VAEHHALRQLDNIRVRGREQPVRIFQVLTNPAGCPGLDAYQRGRDLLNRREWNAAAAAFAAGSLGVVAGARRAGISSTRPRIW
jgi:hypothetical protein